MTELATWDRARADVDAAGPLHALVCDPDVTDVLLNGPGVVWVDRGRGAEPSDVRVDDEHQLRRLAHRLVASTGRRLDDACPYADAVLADGTRVHAVLPPIAPQGTTLSLRIPPRRAFTLDELVDRCALPAAGAELLRAVVRARLSLVVSGGTGTGKTTVLSTLLSEVDPGERIVVIEDAPELRPTHPHVVRLQTRHPNAEGAGAIELAELVKQALRMRPDRLIVGEVRGPEVVDLLAAMNTGHDGGAATLHANRSEHVPARFEALCAVAGLSADACHAQLAAALHVVVHLRRDGDGRRQVAGVAVAATASPGRVRVVPAYGFMRGEVRRADHADVLDALLSAG